MLHSHPCPHQGRLLLLLPPAAACSWHCCCCCHAGGDPTAKRAGYKTGASAASSEGWFDAQLAHQRRKRKAGSKGTCGYCGKASSCTYDCADCGVALHYPSGAFDWPCAERYHSCSPQYRKYCWGEHRANKKTREKFTADPQVKRIWEEARRQQTPSEGSRTTVTVTQTSRPPRRRPAAASGVVAAVALPASGN